MPTDLCCFLASTNFNSEPKVTAPPSCHSLLLFGQFHYSLLHEQCLYVRRMDVKKNLMWFPSLEYTFCLMTFLPWTTDSLDKTHWNTKILHSWWSGIRKMSDGSRFETFGSICCFIFKSSSTFNKDLAGYSESLIPKCQSPRRHIPYDNNIQIH